MASRKKTWELSGGRFALQMVICAVGIMAAVVIIDLVTKTPVLGAYFWSQAVVGIVGYWSGSTMVYLLKRRKRLGQRARLS